jgi:hypothetical protein
VGQVFASDDPYQNFSRALGIASLDRIRLQPTHDSAHRAAPRPPTEENRTMVPEL